MAKKKMYNFNVWFLRFAAFSLSLKIMSQYPLHICEVPCAKSIYYKKLSIMMSDKYVPV